MFFAYVLYSHAWNKIYIGSSADVSSRLLSHNKLAKKGFTVRYRPWVLVFAEPFATRKEALIRERQLKSARGREYIWKIVRSRFSHPEQ